MKNKLLLTMTSLLLAGALVGCTTNNSSEESSANPSSASETSTSESSEPVSSSEESSESESESSEPEELTLEEVLEELQTNALLKRSFVHIPEYLNTECLGPNIFYRAYLDAYASNGQVLEFVNDQGYFLYERANENEEFALDVSSIELDPTIDIYADIRYSVYDVINDDFSNLVTLNEEKEDSFVVDLDVSDDVTREGIAALLGYGPSYYDDVGATTVEISKDANTITFEVVFDGIPENAYVTEFGTHTNAEIEEFVANVPEYIPPVVPDGFLDAIAKIENDGAQGVGKVVSSNGALYELLANGVLYKEYINGSKQVIFNYDGFGYNYGDQGTGYAPVDDPKAGGYNILNSFYTLADLFDGYFADAVLFEEETADAYKGTITKNNLGFYGSSALASLGGYNTSLGGYIDGLAFTMPKDGTAIDITVTASQYDIEYTLSITDLGTLTDQAVDAIVAGIIENLTPPEPASWPSETIASLLAEAGYTDSLPEYTGEFTAVDAYTFYGTIYVDITCDDKATAQTTYGAILQTAGFTPFGQGGAGQLVYGSPNHQYNVSIYQYSEGYNGIYLSITEYSEPVAPSTTFPVDTLNELISGAGTAMVEITGAKEFRLETPYGEGFVEMYVEFENESDAVSLFENYGGLLVDAGFEEQEDSWGDTVYVSADGTFAVQMYDLNGCVVEIDIYLI